MGHASYAQQVLIDQRVTQVFVVGMPLEGAVSQTAIEVLSRLVDVEVCVVEDGCRGSHASLGGEELRKVSFGSLWFELLFVAA